MKSLQYTFTAGEVSPEVHGRIDLDAYQHGLAECRNFTILPHGPAARRPGLEFRAQAFKDDTPCRLIPFVGTSGGAPSDEVNFDSAVLVELGDFYARFHVNGSPLLDDIAPLAITSVIGGVFNVWYVPETWVAGQWVRLTGTLQDGVTPLLDQSYQLANVVTGFPGSFTLRRTTVDLPLDTSAVPTNPTLLQVSRIYTIVSPLGAADLPSLRWAQAPDSLTFTSGAQPAVELRRTGPSAWAFERVAFYPTITPPISVAAVATAGTGTLVHQYVVTALGADLVTESLQSAPAAVSNDLTAANAFNTVSWGPVTDAVYYTVYKLEAGVYGYLGRTKDLKLIDSGQMPDTATSPPVLDLDLNSTAGEYPQAVAYYEQRRVFAATFAKPSTVWATKNGTESNMTGSMPQRDDDAISFKIASQQRSTVQHLVPLNDLLALTRSGHYRVFAGDGGALTYRSVNVKPQGAAGASDTQPVVTPDSVLYAQSQGSHLREIIYRPEGQGSYVSSDVMLLAQHLVEDYPIVELAYTYAPEQTLWAVRSDGVLLSMTHAPEHKVYAWHQHDTDGVVESVAVVPEGGRDVLYVAVKRYTGGVGGKGEVRYIERLTPRAWSSPLTLDGAFFVDGGTTYYGSAQTTINRLWHLEGRYVVGLADGAAFADDNESVFVQNGQITLESAATRVHVGLGYTSRMQTLPMTSGRLEAAGRGKVKSLLGVDVLLKHSSRVKVGQTFDDMFEQPDRTTDMNYDTAPPLFTGMIRVETGLGWENGGTVCVQQDSPLPCTVLSVVPHVELGD